MRSSHTRLVLVGLLLLLSCVWACRREPVGPAPGISNPALGIKLVAVPAGWVVAENDAQGIELRRSVGGSEGRLTIRVGPKQDTGVNLVEAVKERQREIEGQGGTFFGSKQLRTPFGAAYTARGSYKTVMGEVEELTVFALHPAGEERMMTLSYTYPAGSDTTVRSEEIFDVLAQVEALAPTPGAET